MRKLLFLFIVVLSLGLIGCGSDESGQVSAPESSNTTESKDGKPVEAAGEEKGVKIGDEISLDGGNYLVKINEIRRSKDHEGVPAVVLNYTFTNNSDETTSALLAVFFSVFQDGVELEPGLFVDGEEVENGLKDLRPGNAIDCETSFLMSSENELEIEISSMAEMFSGDVVLLKVDAPK